jgi:hypothetical protein
MDDNEFGDGKGYGAIKEGNIIAVQIIPGSWKTSLILFGFWIDIGPFQNKVHHGDTGDRGVDFL